MTIATSSEMLPPSVTFPTLVQNVYEWMHPYNDSLADCRQGISDALEGRPAPGGFVICSTKDEILVGALVMLCTGMKGYIPPNLLLFVAVSPTMRNIGIGKKLILKAIEITSGPIKLHVEADNPARFIYEKLGFRSAYLDMRLNRSDVSL